MRKLSCKERLFDFALGGEWKRKSSWHARTNAERDESVSDGNINDDSIQVRSLLRLIDTFSYLEILEPKRVQTPESLTFNLQQKGRGPHGQGFFTINTTQTGFRTRYGSVYFKSDIKSKTTGNH